jgi:hypothetical protein
MPAVVNKAVILLYVVQFAGLIRIIVHLLVGTTPAERASPIVLMLSIANAIGMIFWLLGKIDNGQTWARNTYLNLFILGALISLPKINQVISIITRFYRIHCSGGRSSNHWSRDVVQSGSSALV